MIWLATLVSHSFKKSAGPFHHASVPVADPLMFSQRGMYEGQPPLIAELDSCSMFAVVLVLYIYIYIRWYEGYCCLKKDSNDVPVRMGKRSCMSHRFKVVSLTCLQKQSNGERDNQHQNQHWFHQRLWACVFSFLCKLWKKPADRKSVV